MKPVHLLITGHDLLAVERFRDDTRHNAETVHAYATQSERPKSINYRGSDLFGQKATHLYTGFNQSVAEAVTASRTEELWLLEDMTITAVACVSVDFGGGTYCTEYREDKGNP